MSYFDEAHRPAGIIYPVSRIPNLDGIVEVSPRVVSGQPTGPPLPSLALACAVVKALARADG